jgi:hypothetical protein
MGPVCFKGYLKPSVLGVALNVMSCRKRDEGFAPQAGDVTGNAFGGVVCSIEESHYWPKLVCAREAGKVQIRDG